MLLMSCLCLAQKTVHDILPNLKRLRALHRPSQMDTQATLQDDPIPLPSLELTRAVLEGKPLIRIHLSGWYADHDMAGRFDLDKLPETLRSRFVVVG